MTVNTGDTVSLDTFDRMRWQGRQSDGAVPKLQRHCRRRRPLATQAASRHAAQLQLLYERRAHGKDRLKLAAL